MLKDTKVKILSGKYKGNYGIFICWTEPHKFSNKRAAQVKYQTGLGWRTLVLNENNIEEYL